MLKQIGCGYVIGGLFERCVISKGVKTNADKLVRNIAFERCVISKGVKTLEIPDATKRPFERCVISKGVKTCRCF